MPLGPPEPLPAPSPSWHRRSQPEAPYFLARSRAEELGYVSTGEFVWLVRRDQAGRVGWVSDDYFVYFDSLERFEAEPSRVARLPLVRRG